MNCCDDPRPRISERNGRMFCANCRRFLDGRDAPQEPSRDEEVADAKERTPAQEGDPE